MTLKRNFAAVLIHPIEDKPFKKDVKFKLNPDGRTYAVDQVTGNPIELDPGRDMTLRDVAYEAIGAVLQTQEPMPGADIVRLLDLAQRIKQAPSGIVEFADETEITLLKERITKVYRGNVFLVGTAFKLLTTDYAEPVTQVTGTASAIAEGLPALDVAAEDPRRLPPIPIVVAVKRKSK